MAYARRVGGGVGGAGRSMLWSVLGAAITWASPGALRSTITGLTRRTVGVWHGQLGQQLELAGVPWPCSPASLASSAQTAGLSAMDDQATAAAATSATESFSRLTPRQ